MQYFSDGSELIAKTTWLSYVGSTYNSISESDMARFNNTVLSKSQIGGYKSQYISELASVDIISVNNTSHLAEIKAILGDKNFLTDLCDLMGGGLTYKDISEGKYKIAFEPVAYFRYNGQNWAMSATECGLLNKYMKNYFTAAWNTTNNLRALLGPLTHSNLPRSAFLENKDLGISVYSPSTSDYYNGNSNYNSDTCIIRCMGIGVLTGNSDDDEVEEGTAAAEYHTDTDVYTSFYAVNTVIRRSSVNPLSAYLTAAAILPECTNSSKRKTRSSSKRPEASPAFPTSTLIPLMSLKPYTLTRTTA